MVKGVMSKAIRHFFPCLNFFELTRAVHNADGLYVAMCLSLEVGLIDWRR